MQPSQRLSSDPGLPVGAPDGLVPASLAERGTRDGALAAWVATSLLGVLLGVVLAKYGQAWAADAWHPSAAWGAVIVALSVLLVVVAGYRYVATRRHPRLTRSEHLLLTLATTVVMALAWAALAVIVFAGSELPPRGRP